MTDPTPTGPLVERVARAMEEVAISGADHKTTASFAADLLRRAGIGEPGLVWTFDGHREYVAPTPFADHYAVTACLMEDGYRAYRVVGTAEFEIAGAPFPDEASARAACGADYAARMLAAGYVPAAIAVAHTSVDEARYRGREAIEDLLYDPYHDEQPPGYTRIKDWCGEASLDDLRSWIEEVIDAALATSPAPVVASPQEGHRDE